MLGRMDSFQSSRLPLDAKGIFWRACRDGDAQVAQRLLAQGLDPHAAPEPSASRWPPLSMAAKGGHDECVRLLLRHGADPNRRALHAQTALMAAASQARPACVDILLLHADPNARDADGASALAHALSGFMNGADEDDAMACVALLAPKTDPQLRGSDGADPLMLAAYFGLGRAVEILAPFFPLNARNPEGLVAADLAQRNGFGALAAILRKRELDEACPPPCAQAIAPRL